MIGCSKESGKRLSEKMLLKKEKKPRFKFNPGLAVIGFRSTGPSGSKGG